jgi:hypothetical protein
MVLDAAGAEKNELVRLSGINMRVCAACKRCADSNRRVIKDGVNPLLDKIVESGAFLLSGRPSFGSLNALTRVFIERNWPLRHNFVLTKGKTGAAVAAGASPLEGVGEFFQNYFAGHLGMDFAAFLPLDGNVPRITCGCGEGCEASGFPRRHGPGAKVTRDKFCDPLADPDAQKRARQLGEAVGASILARRAERGQGARWAKRREWAGGPLRSAGSGFFGCLWRIWAFFGSFPPYMTFLCPAGTSCALLQSPMLSQSNSNSLKILPNLSKSVRSCSCFSG